MRYFKMIDPITESLLQELPSDSALQAQFKLMIDDEADKCNRVQDTPNYEKCRAWATSYAIKKFLYKYGDAPDEVVEMAHRKLDEIRRILER
jgi:hypothetical protein